MPHSVSVDTSHENGHLKRAIARERAQKETEERAWKYLRCNLGLADSE